MRTKKVGNSKTNPLSYFFLNDMPPAEHSKIGWDAECFAISKFKREYKKIGSWDLMMYLHAWNARGGNPYTDAELRKLATTLPSLRPSKKEQEKPGLEAFSKNLFEDM